MRFRGSHDKIRFGYLYIAGLLTGIIGMVLGKSALLGHSGLWGEGTLLQVIAMDMAGGTLFVYLLGRRGLRFLLLSLLATTYLGAVLCMAAAYWYGFACGCLLAAAVLRYGLRGLLLALAGVLPQGVLYAPLAYSLLNWCAVTCNMIYRKDMRPLGEPKTPVMARRVFSWFLLFGILTAGCALEGFVNPLLLKAAARLVL